MTRPDLRDVAEFVAQVYPEPVRQRQRLQEVTREVARTGTYQHTTAELEAGARLAWRNANRCIGRLFWDTLEVIDRRDLSDLDGIERALVDHLRVANNGGGRIRPTLTVLPREVRIENHELIAYAGYRSPDGIIGDPLNLATTDEAIARGWEPPGGRFDVLPVMLSTPWGSRLFTLPDEVVREVDIRDERLPSLAALGVRWYALPVLSDMTLEVGGIAYTAAPFNGWYMATEVGARDLADAYRYDLLPIVAADLGLDTSSDATLWRDEALVALTRAVVDSYRRARVTIVDHHTAARQHAAFERKERAVGRTVTGEWAWLIPPMSPATTCVWERQYPDEQRSPTFRHR